jgi:hypothetical protein
MQLVPLQHGGMKKHGFGKMGGMKAAWHTKWSEVGLNTLNALNPVDPYLESTTW